MTMISSSLLVNGAADHTIIQTKNYRNNNNYKPPEGDNII